MSYTYENPNGNQQFTAHTIILNLLPKEEHERLIIAFARKLAKKKWYQSKKPYIEEIVYNAKMLNKHYPEK